MIRRIKNIYHLLTAILASMVYRFPGNKMRVIGVTGTDGKTTTVSIIYHILKSAGLKVSMLNSVGAYIGAEKYDTGFHVTTPSPFSLQKFLKKAADKGSQYFVLEVTSHALDQYRVWGIQFEIGVLTNITSEHLDYHKTYDSYVKAKSKLLKLAKSVVINQDDDSFKSLELIKKSKNKSNWITYGFSKNSDVNLEDFKVDFKNLQGDFNKYNALAAVACVKVLGISDEKIKNALNTFKLPVGRVDYVYDKEFKVLIDFAHTPNAFEQLLNSVRSETLGRIIHVFGSAGERDKAKRPHMGRISSNYSDVIIFTAEDPRSENVNTIMNEISAGISSKSIEVVKIPDRKEAIVSAIKMANKNDLVLITGKAHEKSMTYGKKDMQWDEYKAVKSALFLIKKNEK